jgi:hypothetical protein
MKSIQNVDRPAEVGFVIYLAALSVAVASNGIMTKKWYIIKYLEGRGCDVIELLPWLLPRNIEETHNTHPPTSGNYYITRQGIIHQSHRTG